MSIVESDGPPSWSLDASETGESTKCPWVGVVEGTAGEKNRETVTASLCLLTISSPGEETCQIGERTLLMKSTQCSY